MRLAMSARRAAVPLVLAVLWLAGPAPASAVTYKLGPLGTLTFDVDPIVTFAFSLDPAGGSVDVGDFRVTADVSSGGFVQIGDRPGLVNEGDPKIFIANGAAVSISRVDGAPFIPATVGFYGGTRNAEERWAEQLQITRTYIDGTSASFTPPLFYSSSGSGLIRLTSFDPVVSVLFTPLSGTELSLDDLSSYEAIAVQDVPLPPAALLMLVALGGLAGLRRA